MVETKSARFELIHANLGYGGHCVLTDINLKLESNSVTCLLGANGVGKTTLFKSILGTLPTLSGKILLNGKPIHQYSTREFARYVAYVPQDHSTPYSYSVLDVVLFGRATHLGYFEQPGKKDREIAEFYLQMLGIEHLRDKPFLKLSGGERQMVTIARVLAQETPFIIFDEPTFNLDYGNQIRVIEKIRLLKKRSIGILMATHSPDQAFVLGADVILLEGGKVFRKGYSENILTSEVLKKTYGVNVKIMSTPNGQNLPKKVCIPEFN